MLRILASCRSWSLLESLGARLALRGRHSDLDHVDRCENVAIPQRAATLADQQAMYSDDRDLRPHVGSWGVWRIEYILSIGLLSI